MLYACHRCGAVSPERLCPEHAHLRSTVRNKLPEVQRLRRRLIKRVTGCQRCGRPGRAGLEMHHVLPVSEGGVEEDGVLFLCPRCHRPKEHKGVWPDSGRPRC